MKRFVGFSLALVAVVAFAATQAFARGGHGGGGHHGGGHHAHHSSHHHSHHASHHNRHHHVAHHGNHRAFSHDWYNHHHGAWGWGNGGYGWGNPWAAATLGATAGWLGANALDWNNGYPATTVYTGNNETVENAPADNATVNNDESGEAASDPQTADNGASDDANDNEPEVSSAEAAALATQGSAEPAKDAKFLPLGVFTIAPENQDEATATLHLAVSKDGVLRGTLLDLKTQQDHNIQGAVDKKTGLVAWTVASDGKVVFQTSLKDLTEQSGPVAVHFANGKSDTWTIAHYSEKDAEDQESKTGNNAEQSPAPAAETGNSATPK